MRCTRLWIVALAAAAAAIGCQGNPVPLGVQQGATAVIPIRPYGYEVQPNETDEIGYGGVEEDGVTPIVTDYQRGTLIYHLDTQDGPALITRGTTVVTASPMSPEGRQGNLGLASQVFSVVDIPLTAPLGTHSLFVGRRLPGQTTETPITIAAMSITILPHQFTVNGTTYTGASTPFDALTNQSGANLPSPLDTVRLGALPTVVPDPEIRITLSQGVWGAQVNVVYPSSVIHVVDALEPPIQRSDHLASVWFQDNPAKFPDTTPPLGLVTVNAVATEKAFNTLSIVFQLKDGAAATLNQGQVFISIRNAWDQNGNVISGVTASVPQIF